MPSRLVAPPVVPDLTPPAGACDTILAAVHQAAAALESGAASRTNLKKQAALIASFEQMCRICVPDMKAHFDHPDRPGSTMMKRLQEAWEALGRHYCEYAGLRDKQIKVRALDYAGRYRLVLEDKDPVDGLREVVKVAKKYGVFVADELERMYADKHRSGMVFRTYWNAESAANDDGANDCAHASDASQVECNQQIIVASNPAMPSDEEKGHGSAASQAATTAMPDNANLRVAFDSPPCEATNPAVSRTEFLHTPAMTQLRDDDAAPCAPANLPVPAHGKATRPISRNREIDAIPINLPEREDGTGSNKSSRTGRSEATGQISQGREREINLPEPVHARNEAASYNATFNSLL